MLQGSLTSVGESPYGQPFPSMNAFATKQCARAWARGSEAGSRVCNHPQSSRCHPLGILKTQWHLPSPAIGENELWTRRRRVNLHVPAIPRSRPRLFYRASSFMCNTESKQAPSVVLQVSDTGPGTSSLVLVPWYSTELKLHVPYGYPTPQVWTQSATARSPRRGRRPARAGESPSVVDPPATPRRRPSPLLHVPSYCVKVS